MARRDTEIYFPRDQWLIVRSDDRFVQIVQLARVTNALAMAYPVLSISVRYQSPRARRDRASAFLYTAAVLFEGLDVSRRLAKDFRHLPQFESGFGTIHHDRSVEELESRYLKRLRDKAAFHFDRDVYAEALKELDFPEARFASTRDLRRGSFYFDIADDAIFAFLTGATSDKEHFERLDELMTSTANLANRFLVASHRLIPTVLQQLGALSRKFKADPVMP